MNVKKLALSLSSAAFLQKRIPKNWDDMNVEEQSDFLQAEMVIPDYNSTDGIYECIDSHSCGILIFVKEILKDLKEKIIESAIDGTLPSDMNELDLGELLRKP